MGYHCPVRLTNCHNLQHSHFCCTCAKQSVSILHICAGSHIRASAAWVKQLRHSEHLPSLVHIAVWSNPPWISKSALHCSRTGDCRKGRGYTSQSNVVNVQVVNGLTSLLANGSSTNGNLSSLESYNTALSFVQALGRTQDSNGNTTAVSLFRHIA